MRNKNTLESFIEKARKVHGDKYDYSKVEYNGIHTKVCIICPEHGEFWQEPNSHLHRNGCPECSGLKKPSLESFIEKARKVHGDKYDYSKVEYVNNHTKVCIVCAEHGEFWMTPSAHINLRQGCKYCSGRKLTLDGFIEKAKKVHGDKYDYSKVKYINNKTKVCIICPEHGEFWQEPSHHLLGQNCPKCSNEYSPTTDEWIERAKKVHGDKYDYSKSVYVNAITKICVVCPKHGEFWVFPNNHLKGNGCPNCKKSKLENLLAFYLLKNNISFTFNKKFEWLRNKNPMSLDFYLPDYNIGIECQGEQHLVEGRNFTNKSQLSNDLLKNKLCEENGVKLLYFGDTPIDDINCNKNIYNKKNYFIDRNELMITILPK